MDIEKYKQAKALAEKLSPLIDIIGILENHKVAPELFFGHFEFVFGNRTLLVPGELNNEILQILIKHRNKLQKEFEEL